MQSLHLTLDDLDLQDFSEIARQSPGDSFAYVVTPNVDHLIRYHDDDAFRAMYSDAKYTLLDSRFLARVLRLTHKLDIKVCPGSDLTAQLLRNIIKPDDSVVLIGASTQQAESLRKQFDLRQLHHFNPPMGFVRDANALEDCLSYIESHSPFRYCLLAVGCPQQEKVAALLKQRGKAHGMAFCIGASINFLTGEEQRAPLWMQRHSLEWLYRLLQNPKRLAGRYLIRGPRIFWMLRKFSISKR